MLLTKGIKTARIVTVKWLQSYETETALSNKDKLIQRLKSVPADFKYSELRTLLSYLEYIEDTKGKTSGSRVGFVHHDYAPIMIHKPHPGDEMKKYAVKMVKKTLEDRGQI